MRISTHTLTWSVTHRSLSRTIAQAISTHTLTWSVTDTLIENLPAIIISTHTLTWSVTQPKPTAPHNTANFNSHAHVERDER